MIQKISIIACGWLGLPLAEFLVQKGYKVKGSTTTASKLKAIQSKGIQANLIQLGANFNGEWQDFLDCDLLIVCIPPSASKENPELPLKQIIAEAKEKKVSRVLYTSATSVYPSNNSIVKESDATYIKSPHSGVEMLALEELFTKSQGFKTSILRLAGLFGGDRLPGKYLAGKKDLPNGNQPVNMIHLEDCIDIIHALIQKDLFPEIMNACSDIHPSREEFYTVMAEKNGWPLPHFSAEKSKPHKIVSNEKLKKLLNYRFVYANPLDAL
ncbi:MAG: NAD(P)H-binding protein [Chitinophagales bacterium]